MAGGKVRCCGSSLFLKRLYGVGYTFTISLKIGIKAIDVKPSIDNIVLNHVPTANGLSIAGGEINYRLPFEQSGLFANMFQALDESEKKDNIGINSYGISVTTLEEVFLKIGGDNEPIVEGAEEAKAAESQFVSPSKPNNNQATNSNINIDIAKNEGHGM